MKKLYMATIIGSYGGKITNPMLMQLNTILKQLS